MPKAKIYEALDPRTGEKVAGTLAELADRYGIQRRTLYARLENGLDISQALLPAPPRKPAAPSGHAGKAPTGQPAHTVMDPATGEAVTGTVRELIRHFGLRTGTYYTRRRAGMDMQQALTEPLQVPVYELEDPETGEPVRGTLPALAERYGIPYNRLAARLRQGMGIGDAVALGPDIPGKAVEVRNPRTGETAKGTVTALARRFGLKPCTVAQRMKKGATLEEALFRPLDPGKSRSPNQPRTGPDLEPSYTVRDPATGEEITGSLSRLAGRFGISPATARHRVLDQGMTAQEALAAPLRPRPEIRRITVDGQAYEGTATAICRRLGVSPSSVANRTGRGKDFEEAVLHVLRADKGPALHDAVDPETGETVRAEARELAARSGASVSTVYSRIRNGAPAGKLLGPPRPKKLYDFPDPETGEIIRGNLRKAAALYGIPRTTLLHRMEAQGMSLEEALSADGPRHHAKEYEYRDPDTGELRKDTLRGIADRHGIPESTLRRRLSQSSSMEEALAPRRPGRAKSDYAKAVEETARLADMSPATLKSRLYAGLTLEQALAKPVRPYAPRRKRDGHEDA